MPNVQGTMVREGEAIILKSAIKPKNLRVRRSHQDQLSH